MFVLKKIAAAFVLPPGLFVTLLVGAALYLLIKRKSRKKLLVFLLGLAGLIWVLSVAPVGDLLTRSLESAVPPARDPRGDVIVVLHGAGQRLGPAVALQSALKVPLLLCGYSYLRDHPADEARLRSNLGQAGVAPAMILIEKVSRDTQENIRAAKALCRQRGFGRPLVITSAFHARRVRLTCRRQGFRAVIVPVDYTVAGRPIRYTWRDALPMAEYLYGSSLAISEYLGLVFYRVAY